MAQFSDGATSAPRPFLVNAVVVVVVLGLLPVLWEAAPVWRVVGPLLAVVYAARAAVVVWRRVFSTRPRDLTAVG